VNYHILITSKAKKQIDRLPQKIKEKIGSAILEIASNPLIGKALKAQLKGLYSFRAGNYRIVYEIDNKKICIFILKVMHRREVYRD